MKMKELLKQLEEIREIIAWNDIEDCDLTDANFMVTAGYRKSTYKQLSFSKGPLARDAAITYALSLRDKYRIEGVRI